MTDYDPFVKQVTDEIPDADVEEVRAEFQKYEEQFRIEPGDALRSIMNRFKSANAEVSMPTPASAPVSRTVKSFEELGANDRDITIEVRVVSYTPRAQMVRGEERQIAFGWIEDSPFDGKDSVRWDYKDWGNNGENLRPGAIVRLEGVSVNEYKGKRSLNVNQSSRVVVLQEGGANPLPTSEPVDLSVASTMEGPVSIVARVIAVRPDVITKRDGSGTIDVVRGKLADSTGQMSFLCWGSFNHEVGELLRFEGVTVRRFRDTPELNFSDRTSIEVFRDAAFPEISELETSSRMTIADIRDGMRDVSVVVQIESMETRTFTREGEEKSLLSVRVLDPSGRCKMTVWEPIDLVPGEAVLVKDARIRAWQGTPDITVDQASQIESLGEPSWGKIDPAEHVVELHLWELAQGGSRDGISTTGDILVIRDDCGIIQRCPECRRVLRDGVCADHDVVEGVDDLRFRFVIDDGVATANLLLGRGPTEALTGETMDEIRQRIEDEGRAEFLKGLRERWFGERMRIKGRGIVDDRGVMIMADSAIIEGSDPSVLAAKVRADWGVVL
tara:strand:+ start:5531 stop:7201 length:1671 start_codon:yes stop_codon:yes gene_type:complete